MNPTIGRIVHYKLSATDADAINRRRSDWGKYVADVGQSTSYQAHVGNRASEGDAYPAVVVRTFGGPNVNLQVWLDGNDAYWATSRAEGDGAGCWSWPARS